MKNTVVVASALAAAISLATVATAQAADEKCYGIAKAGKNDCQTSTGSSSPVVTASNISSAVYSRSDTTCAV